MWGTGGLAAAAAVLVLAGGGCGGDDDDGVPAPGPAPAASCLPREDEPGKVAVRPRWTVGDNRAITVERSVASSTQGGPSKGSAAGEISVLRASAAGSLLRYRTGSYYPVGLGEIPPEVVQRLEKEIPGPTLEYGADREGRFVAVENRSALRRQMLKVMEAAERFGANEGIPPETQDRLRELAGSDVLMDQTAIDPILMHRPYGLVLELETPLRVSQPMASPFGGRSIPARGTFELTNGKDSNGCVAIDATLTARPADVAEAYVDTMKLFEPGERPDRSALAELSAGQEMRFQYDPVSGWVVRAEQTLRISGRGGEATQTTVVTLR